MSATWLLVDLMGVGRWCSFGGLLEGAFSFGAGFLGLLASARLMAMRLYKIFDVDSL